MSIPNPTEPEDLNNQRYGEDQDEVDDVLALLGAPETSLAAFDELMWSVAHVIYTGHSQALQEDLAALLPHLTARKKEAILMVFEELRHPITHPALIEIWQELWEGEQFGWVLALITCENLGIHTLEELKQMRAEIAEDRLGIFDQYIKQRMGETITG